MPVSKTRSSGAAMVLAALLAACGGSVVDSTPPVVPPDTTTHSGTVQRGSLTVRVAIDAADLDIASAAGVTAGGVTVRLTRNASNDPARSVVTAADGTARFDSLLQGVYQASIDRTLTATELAHVPPDNQGASIFAGGATVVVAPPSTQLTISLVASSRGSLVFSEVFIYNPGVVGGMNDQYMEVFNAADTTIYLDGILVFRTGGLHGSFPDRPCATTNYDARMDPTGVWSTIIHRFPGNGRDYMLLPGNAAVIAIDAVDHRPLGPGGPDLSRAEFELIGDASDPNNPYSADMIRMKGTPATHGETFGGDMMIGVALPIATDTAQLARMMLQSYVSGNAPYSAFKIPREAILDVAGIMLTPEFATSGIAYAAGYRICNPFSSPVFERSPAALIANSGFAISRKSLGHTASGIEILQRTRTSARDFEWAMPLRRSLFPQ